MSQITNSIPSCRASGSRRMRSRTLLTIAGAAAVFTLYLAIMPHAASAQTQALSGNHPQTDALTMSSRADASLPLNIHISFAPRNPAMLAKLLTDLQDPASPQYHQWLSPTAFNSKFGRTADEISDVRQWLSTQGMSVVESSPRGLTSTATVAQAESAFATTMIATSDGSIYANANDPQIPARFAGVIGSIEGLSNTGHSLALNVRPLRVNASKAQSNQLSTSRNPTNAIAQSRPPPRAYEASLIAELPEYDNGSLG